jgi:hypothetical protein
MADARMPDTPPRRRPLQVTADRDEGHAVAGDAERRSADKRLQDAVGAGAISLADYEERAACVWTAKTASGLASATAGLPEPPVTPGPARRTSGLSRRALSAGWGLSAVGAVTAVAMIVGASDEPSSRRDRSSTPVVVPADVQLFDVGRHADEVTIVVPDGVGVELNGLVAGGTIWCDDACAWPIGPWVQLQGAALEGVHVMSRSEYDRGEDLEISVIP